MRRGEGRKERPPLAGGGQADEAYKEEFFGRRVYNSARSASLSARAREIEMGGEK